MGAQSQPNSNPSVNAPNALLAAGQAVATPVVPTTLIPVHDKNGKQIMVTVNGVRAIIQGYDKATGKLHLTCADTEENQKKFNRSTQPKTDRAKEPTTDATVKFFRDSQGNPLTITVKNPALASKVAGSQMILTQQEAESAIKKSKRTLMHVVAKSEITNTPPVKTDKEEESWWSKHWWKVLIGVLVATTIGILGFRKGGWWNKRKKTKTPTSTSTSTPEPVITTPPVGPQPDTPTLNPGFHIDPNRTDTPGQTIPYISAPEPSNTPTEAPTLTPTAMPTLGQTVSTSAHSATVNIDLNFGR